MKDFYFLGRDRWATEAQCKLILLSSHFRLREKFITLRQDLDKTRKDLEEKQDNNQLTKEVSI